MTPAALRKVLETGVQAAAAQCPKFLAPDSRVWERVPPNALTPALWRAKVAAVVRGVLLDEGVTCTAVTEICERRAGVDWVVRRVWVDLDGLVTDLRVVLESLKSTGDHI